MAPNIRPTAGTKMYVSAAVPSTLDTNATTGYPSLTWTEVKGFSNFGEIGDMDEVGNFDLIDGGRTKYRAITDPGEVENSGADYPTDPGQIILKDAKFSPRGSTAEKVSIRIEDEAGIGTYAVVLVSKWRRVYGGASDIQVRAMTLPIIAGTIVEY
ncbi:hypothetical protein [Profundibacterium mesophilum]|uniref:Uncharacterized protein n=1 Tax=Profundibacterium mesophilum KAUST100406-0324 TaxID=1037889 RepID=A0A921NTT9_9RHOB|nr:hypothetical protein [Profundibacterium mesophilum]KAF0675071.1 hypothetical protein PMES_02592 [Profundibacterium mesophilum KAUST100406-0324]